MLVFQANAGGRLSMSLITVAQENKHNFGSVFVIHELNIEIN